MKTISVSVAVSLVSLFAMCAFAHTDGVAEITVYAAIVVVLVAAFAP